MKPIIFLTAHVCIVMAAPAWAGNWPGWRGPEGTGVSTETSLPESWTTNANVRWRIDLPGPGNSSPIVWGDKVFITQSVQKENRRTLMCFNRADGKLLWQSGVTYAEEEPTQESNPYCSATPATDGERVIAFFGSAGLCCYDFSGKQLWCRDLGKIAHMFGSGASPILSGDLCFLNFGPGVKARLVAVDKRDGHTVWEAEPPKVDPSEQPPMRGPGPGGRGGFGPGMIIGPQLLAQADKNSDQKLSKDELTALADAWFDKLDPDKTGKLSQEQFVAKLPEVLPPPEGFGPPGDRPPGGGAPGPGGPPPGGGRGGFGPGRMIGPALFTAADSDKDGSLTRGELKSTFEKWFTDWDKEKAGLLTEDQLREGLNAVLPRPQFGGPGGGPGGPGGGRGRGGRGGPGGGGPGGGGDPSGSWSTPLIVKAGDHDELIMNFPSRLVGFEPKTGKQLWISKGIGNTIYTTPLSGENTLVAMSSDMNGAVAIAVKPGGSGEATDSQRLWRLERIKRAIGSGVIYQGHWYSIDQDGIAACRDLKTGEKVWEERLQGPGARGSSWSSMLLANGKIYVPNQSGDVFVLRAGPKFELLSTNSVHEPTNASLAASNGDLFLRTDKSLWCFAAPGK
jgi:outer membrane protein assembly factor BamB